jgi:hypothetical protein
MSEQHQDLAALDDPAFLAERRRVGEELQALTERYRRLDEEFIRRARAEWAPAGSRSDR